MSEVKIREERKEKKRKKARLRRTSADPGLIQVTAGGIVIQRKKTSLSSRWTMYPIVIKSYRERLDFWFLPPSGSVSLAV